MYIVDKAESVLWQREIDEFLKKQQESSHRLAKNYHYDYSKADELTVLVEDDVIGLACMVKWNDVATRVMYRWARDRDIPRQDHVYGELSRAVLDHQLPKVTTPYAFIGLDGKRERLIRKWADAAGWETTAGWVLPKHYQQIAYIQLEDTDYEFNPRRD